MRVGYLTDKGMKRPKNEDAVKVLKMVLAEISLVKSQALRQ